MNINDITPGTMYDAIRNGILTEKAFQEWLDNRITSTPYNSFFPLPVPGKRTRVTFPFSKGVAYIGLRNGGKDFDVRFEVDDYDPAPERTLATFGVQRLNKENLRETIGRIEDLFTLCDFDGANPRSSEDLCERVQYA